QARVEGVLLAAAVEIRAVKLQRAVDLEPGYAEGHHDIGHGVGLREEVFYLPAGADIPVRHARVVHLALRALGQAAALADGFHYLEALLVRHALRDEVEHDVVAAADGLLDARRA